MQKNKLFYNRIIFILSILGISIALYVTQSFIRNTSIFCVNSGCEVVRKNPASYIYGLPVPAVGLVGYSIIAIFSFLQTTKYKPVFMRRAILFMASFGVLFVSWFSYTEVFIIKGICTWCAISTINMLIIFGLALFNLREDNTQADLI